MDGRREMPVAMSGMRGIRKKYGETCLVESASHYNFIGIGVSVGGCVRNTVIRRGDEPSENNSLEVLRGHDGVV
jgi:hypothetical protein